MSPQAWMDTAQNVLIFLLGIQVSILWRRTR